MNVFADFRRAVQQAVHVLAEQNVLPGELPLHAITVEPPRDPAHGDLATNVAMVLAKPAKLNPRALAEKLQPLLAAHEAVTAVEIAGPGFINLRLKPAYWQAQAAVILQAGPAYGDSKLGAGEPVNVEYVSANPTGPMHVGHCRGAVFGDALAALLEKAGFQVCREYYINDAGAQVDVLARSAHLRYREALGESIEIPEGLYPGDYLKPVGAVLAKQYGERYPTLKIAVNIPSFDAPAGFVVRKGNDAFREALKLHRPIYQKTAAYGHFGRKAGRDGSFSWEKTDLAKALKDAVAA